MKIEKLIFYSAILCAGLSAPNSLHAAAFSPLEQQQVGRKIKGSVLDNNNQPLIGVNVSVKGTTTGTITDQDGNFSLDLNNKNAILWISYIGYLAQDVKAVDGDMTIVLKEDEQALDEVVVIGYGVQRKSDLTGSVARIGSEKLVERQVVNPVDALAGKIAGVQVNNNSGKPGGKMSIVIRGFNSINASNEPLFVIDGIVGADISLVNPNEIESMNVLKDASSTAIYGARGAAGVILVTTKRGDFESGTRVTYNLNLGISKMANKLDVMNSDEFMSVLNQGMANDGFEKIDWHKANPSLFNTDGSPIYNTDWQDEVTRTSFSNRHYLTVNTGSKTSRSTVALGYQNEQGIMEKSWLTRYNAKLSNDTKINDRIQLTSSLNYNYTKESNWDNYRVGSNTPSRLMLECFPVLPVKYANGEYSKFGDFRYPSTLLKDGQPVLNDAGQKKVDYGQLGSFWGYSDNTVQTNEDVERYLTTNQLLGNVDLSIKIIEGLTFKSTAAVEVKWFKEAYYTGSKLIEYSADGANAYQGVNNNIYWQSENFLTYDKTFGSHKLNAMAGASWSGSMNEGLTGSGTGFSSDFYKFYNIGKAEKPGIPGTSWSEWKMNSYYARINYSYKSKYLATVTGRYDGSSVFGADNRYAFFPSGALAWVIKEEDFLKENEVISNLKLRASVGQTGNAGINAYSTLAGLGGANLTFGDKTLNKGTIQSGMPNSNLKWETTTQYDLGLDLGFVNNRIALGLDFYIKDTKDLLLAKPVSWVTGYGSVMDNIGEVRNKGFEATLNTHNVASKDFNWFSTLLFSTNKNEVIKLSGDESDIWSAGFIGINYSLIRKGEAINTIYGLKRSGSGTWGTSEATEAAKYGKKPGDKKYVDKNNDGKIDYQNDGEVLGNLFPDFELSFSNTIQYKNFDLTLDLQAKCGNKAINLARMTYEQRTWYANGSSAVLNYWTPENQNTPIERPRTCMPFGGSPQDLQIDDDLIEDASYLRFKNLMIGYTLPSSIANRFFIKGLRIYANVENFLTITKYSGYDPEVQNMDGFSQGVEFFAYPKSMNVNFGLNLTF